MQPISAPRRTGLLPPRRVPRWRSLRCGNGLREAEDNDYDASE